MKIVVNESGLPPSELPPKQNIDSKDKDSKTDIKSVFAPNFYVMP